LEILLFLGVSAAGIYALGNGLRGMFQPGRGLDLGWLAVTGLAFWILVSQMGRVQDSWPRRRGVEPKSKSASQAGPASGPRPPASGAHRMRERS
jgi:hypothetical protein